MDVHMVFFVEYFSNFLKFPQKLHKISASVVNLKHFSQLIDPQNFKQSKKGSILIGIQN